MSISALSLQNTAHIQKMSDMQDAPLKVNHFGASAPMDFSKTLTSVLNGVNAQSTEATNKINAFELGQSDDMVGAVIAAQKASLSFSALMQVRNKLLSGFDEIMKMPI